MITWIQTTFQKHFRVLFAVLLVVLVVTFVLTIGNQSFFGSGTGNEFTRREFFGYNLASQRDNSIIYGRGQVSAMLTPELGITGQRLESYAQARVAALAMARQFGVPEPTRQQLEEFIQQKAVFQNEEGQFDPQVYNQFVDMVGLQGQFTPQMVVNTLKEDYQIHQLTSAIGGPGFIHPFSAQVEQRERDTVWSLNILTADINTFNPEIDPTEEELKQFFEQSPDTYAEPERLRASVVRFTADAFLNRVPEPSAEEVRSYFERNKMRFAETPPPPAEGEEPVDIVEPELENVRDQVVQAIQGDRARRLAAEAADQFTVTLWRNEIAKGSDRFNELVQQSGGKVEALPPFARNRPPSTSGIPPQLFDSLWQNADSARYFSDFAQTRDGAAVLIFEERIPSRQLPFQEVRDRVETEYRQQERRRLFAEQGEVIRRGVESALAEGRSIEEAAEEFGMQVQSHPDFKVLDAPPQVRFGGYIQTAQTMDAGEVSPMAIRGSQGTFVHVAAKEEPALADIADPEGLAQLTQQVSRIDPWLIYEELARKQMEQYTQAAAE